MISSRNLGCVRYASTMRAWQVHQWGQDLQMNQNALFPVLRDPSDVLVRVKAASVNNIDTLQCNGYGDEFLSKLRMFAYRSTYAGSRLPFTPGRDCAGVVESVGPAVRRFKVGDEVMGVCQPHENGSHADYVVLHEDAVVGKPGSLSFQEAASLPSVACTSWAALVNVALINKENAKKQRVLIHGGAGGVGTFSIQLLKAWGVPKVVVTVSPDSFDLVRSLGAVPVDYNSADATERIIDEGPYEVILDCVDSPLSLWSDKILGSWRNCVHVSLVSPMMKDIDRYGIPAGLASVAYKYFMRSSQLARDGKWFSYAYSLPNKSCLQEVVSLYDNKQLKPVIDRVYPFDKVPEAFEKVALRKGRGKTVVSME